MRVTVNGEIVLDSSVLSVEQSKCYVGNFAVGYIEGYLVDGKPMPDTGEDFYVESSNTIRLYNYVTGQPSGYSCHLDFWARYEGIYNVKIERLVK